MTIADHRRESTDASLLWSSVVHQQVFITMQQILLPSVRVTYNYTTNQLTAMMGSATRCVVCLSTDITGEASQLASSIAGRPVSAIVSNDDNFLFR